VNEIEVFILNDPAKGNFIRTEPDLAGVHSGDNVIWHFHSLLGPKATWVEVEFDIAANPDAKFFPGRSSPPVARCYTQLTGGHGQLHGTAPGLTGAPAAASAKYSIRAYKDGEEPVPGSSYTPLVYVDPNIIVCDP